MSLWHDDRALCLTKKFRAQSSHNTHTFRLNIYRPKIVAMSLSADSVYFSSFTFCVLSSARTRSLAFPARFSQ